VLESGHAVSSTVSVLGRERPEISAAAGQLTVPVRPAGDEAATRGDGSALKVEPFARVQDALRHATSLKRTKDPLKTWRPEGHIADGLSRRAPCRGTRWRFLAQGGSRDE
jgi:hypothetical protein